MYAVVRVSGFQYLVKEGDTLAVPRLDAEPGATVNLDQVLLVRTDEEAIIGRPNVPDSHVEAKVLSHIRAPKVTIFKFRRRENYRRKRGHRQLMTRLQVSKIRYTPATSQ